MHNDFSHAPILLEHDESGWLSGFKSFEGPRWREFHCFAALLRVLCMTRKAVVCRVMPTPGRLVGFVAKLVFGCAIYITQKCSESVHSFDVALFLSRFLGVWLSNGVFKSKK